MPPCAICGHGRYDHIIGTRPRCIACQSGRATKAGVDPLHEYKMAK